MFAGQCAIPQNCTIKQIAARLGLTCVLFTNNTVACFGQYLLGIWLVPFSKPILYIGCGGASYAVCGLATDGTVPCFVQSSTNPYADWTLFSSPSTPMSQFWVGEAGTCGIVADGTGSLVCWQTSHLTHITWGQLSPPAGSFSQIVGGGETFCALRFDNVIVCWGRSDQVCSCFANL